MRSAVNLMRSTDGSSATHPGASARCLECVPRAQQACCKFVARLLNRRRRAAIHWHADRTRPRGRLCCIPPMRDNKHVFPRRSQLKTTVPSQNGPTSRKSKVSQSIAVALRKSLCSTRVVFAASPWMPTSSRRYARCGSKKRRNSSDSLGAKRGGNARVGDRNLIGVRCADNPRNRCTTSSATSV